MNSLEWTDETPTVPGWYVWTMDGEYCVWQLSGDPLIAAPNDLPVSEYDGWWLGPLPNPLPFFRLPRVYDKQTATRPKRQQVRQADVRNLLGVDSDGKCSTGDPHTSVHHHDELCCRLGCLNRTAYPCTDVGSKTDHQELACPGNTCPTVCQADRELHSYSFTLLAYGPPKFGSSPSSLIAEIKQQTL